MNESDIDWDSLEADMPAELSAIIANETLNVSLLSDIDLLEKFHTITDELRTRNEMLNPNTPEGRDLHSVRAATRIELARRKLL